MAYRIAVPVQKVQAAVAYSNLHIGFIAVCFTLGTSALLGVSPSLPLLVLAFCGAFGVYQLERGLGIAPEDTFNQPDRLDWILHHRRYFWLSVGLAAAVGACMLPMLRPQTLGICIALGVCSVLYMTPLLPGRHRMKSVWFLKPLLISGGWAVGGVLLPVVEAGVAVTSGVVALAVYRFLFVVPNTLLADWPDREGDERAGLQTAATLLPSDRLRATAACCLILSMTVGLLAARLDGVSRLLYVDLAGPLLLFACILRPLSEDRWLYSFAIDLVVAWPLVTTTAWWLG